MNSRLGVPAHRLRRNILSHGVFRSIAASFLFGLHQYSLYLVTMMMDHRCHSHMRSSSM